MKSLLVVAFLLMPLCAQAQNAAALLSQQRQDLKCTKPDRTLIRKETALGTVWASEASSSTQYNRQARGFNDCTRLYVESANAEIGRISDAAKAKLDQIGADATAHVRVIENQINATIAGVKAIEAFAPVPDSRASAGDPRAFPLPECMAPDQRLVIPLPRSRDNSARDRAYDGQKAAYMDCMRTWIALAKVEIARIDADAHADMKVVAGDANRQSLEIKQTILVALEGVQTVRLEQSVAVNQLKASLVPPPPPAEDTESVVVTDTRLVRQADSPTGAGDPDAIVCRSRQPLTGSRRWGPEICKRNREWATLYKQGLSISSDGTKLLESEKQRTFRPQSCMTLPTVNGPAGGSTVCQGGP